MSLVKYTEYVTKDGDRLDSIARDQYGDPELWTPIIEANPTVGILRTYPPGIVLRIPVLTYINDAVIRPNLPPWKRI